MDFNKILRERDPTQGSIIKNILAMTWPLWLNSGVYIVFNSINIYWISKIGTQALAALIAGNISYMLMMAPVQGLATASRVLVGNLVGKQDNDELEKTVKEILGISLILSFMLSAFGYIFAPFLFRLIGAEPEIISLATAYLRIQVIGGIASFSLWVINGMIRGSRDMGRPMIVIFLVIVLNTIFDPFFILGWLGFPRLEVAGCAISSALSASIGAVVAFWMLIGGKTPLKIKFKKFGDLKPRIETLKGILRIAGFETCETIGKISFDLILLKFMAVWGVAALAAYSIGQRFLRMATIVGQDLSTTTEIIMSNNLGAGNIKRAGKNTWISAGLNIFFMAAIGAILFFFAKELLNIYSRELEVISIGIKYFRITVFGYIFLAAGIVLRKAFAGAKDTKTPMITNYLSFGAVQISLAWLLPKFFNLGVSGIWWAILTAMVLNGSILAILFKIGFWKPK